MTDPEVEEELEQLRQALAVTQHAISRVTYLRECLVEAWDRGDHQSADRIYLEALTEARRAKGDSLH